MGVCCKINLFTPSDGVYRPGQLVSGVIKYTIDEPIEVEKIVTSLKGIGCIILIDDPSGLCGRTYKATEEFVDVDTIIQEEKSEVTAGAYTAQFSYILPPNIPSTMNMLKDFKDSKYCKDYKVHCYIKYYIRIKFVRPGFFAFNEHFRKEIHVKSQVVSRLSRSPAFHGKGIKLLRLFSREDSIVKVKATIINSALPIGGKIEVQYKVLNRSHVLVKSVKTKMIQAYTFKVKGYHKVIYEEEIPGTAAKSTSVNREDTFTETIEITVPSELCTLENAKIVSRDYFIRIIAQLPLPYKSPALDIPVQIGVPDANANANRIEELEEDFGHEEPPPTYWVAMGETTDDYEYEDDDEIDY